MDEKIAWMQKMLRACGHIEEYTVEDIQMIFPDIHQQYNTLSNQDKMEIKNILLNQLDKKDLLYVLSIMIKNGAADTWIPFALQVAEALNLNSVVRSMLEAQINAVGHNQYMVARNFHKNTVEQWSNAIPILKKYTNIKDRNANRIVIVTEQLISELHAPTKVVLDMAYLFQHIMGMEVMIVALPCNAGKIGEIWYDSYVMNSTKEYEKSPILRKYKEEVFWGFQVSMELSNVRDYAMLLSYILEWNPLFVFSMGTTNPVADVLTYYTTVVAQSMSLTLPVSEAQILIDLGKNDSLIAQLPQTVIRFEETPRYFGEAKCVHVRKMYGIDENQFVCVVVGNRLDREINEEFMYLIQELVRKNKKIAFAFIGNIGQIREMLENNIPCENLYFVNYCEDLLGIYKIMDLYVNPNRGGGGYSAAMAISSKLPVITLDHGDVMKHTGSDFTVSDYSKMCNNILRYVEDEQYRNVMRQKTILLGEKMTEDNMYSIMRKNVEEVIEVVKQGE